MGLLTSFSFVKTFSFHHILLCANMITSSIDFLHCSFRNLLFTILAQLRVRVLHYGTPVKQIYSNIWQHVQVMEITENSCVNKAIKTWRGDRLIGVCGTHEMPAKHQGPWASCWCMLFTIVESRTSLHQPCVFVFAAPWWYNRAFDASPCITGIA